MCYFQKTQIYALYYFCRLGGWPLDHQAECVFLVSLHQHCSGHYKMNAHLNVSRISFFVFNISSSEKMSLIIRVYSWCKAKTTMRIIHSFLLEYGTQQMSSVYVLLFSGPKEVSFLKSFNYLPLSENDNAIVNK